MRIFRDVDQTAYRYYIQDNDTTVLWYPEMTWKSQEVTAVRGRLLAEGKAEEVLILVRDALPPDLLCELRGYYSVAEQRCGLPGPMSDSAFFSQTL